MPRPETRASPNRAVPLLSTVMLLAIIVTTTWLRTGVAHERHRAPALQRRRDPCLACQERRRAPRWAGARVELSTILCRDPGCCEHGAARCARHDPCRSRARRSPRRMWSVALELRRRRARGRRSSGVKLPKSVALFWAVSVTKSSLPRQPLLLHLSSHRIWNGRQAPDRLPMRTQPSWRGMTCPYWHVKQGLASRGCSRATPPCHRCHRRRHGAPRRPLCLVFSKLHHAPRPDAHKL